VRDELRDCLGGIDVPNRTRRINRRRDDETGGLLVPREVGQRGARVLILHFRLLWYPARSSRSITEVNGEMAEMGAISHSRRKLLTGFINSHRSDTS